MNKGGADAGTRRLVYLATAVSALGGMLFGYDIGVISGAILFVRKDFSLGTGMEEVVVSTVQKPISSGWTRSEAAPRTSARCRAGTAFIQNIEGLAKNNHGS